MALKFASARWKSQSDVRPIKRSLDCLDCGCHSEGLFHRGRRSGRRHHLVAHTFCVQDVDGRSAQIIFGTYRVGKRWANAFPRLRLAGILILYLRCIAQGRCISGHGLRVPTLRCSCRCTHSTLASLNVAEVTMVLLTVSARGTTCPSIVNQQHTSQVLPQPYQIFNFVMPFVDL